MSERRRPTLVLGSSRGGARALRRKLVLLGLREWIALVPDYRSIVRMEAALQGTAARRPVSADLHEAAEALRGPFLELTARFAARYDSLAWWASSIGERCTNGSDLFLHCCYVWIAARLLDGPDACIVCDHWAVRGAVARLARARGYRVCRVAWRLPALRETPAWPVAALVAKAGLVALRWLAVRVARHRERTGRDRAWPDVLVSTWLDPASVDANGRLRDRFFPGLISYYGSQGLAAGTILPVPEGFAAFWRTVRRLRRDDAHILPEAWLRLRDVVFPIRLWLQQRRFRFGGAGLGGLDMSGLFAAAHWLEPISFAASLQYPLMRRLAESGIRPQLVVLGFENMVSDKMTILSLRRFMPGTQVFGFCHNPLKRNVLSWYTHRHEVPFAPLPDRVICNGPVYRDILIGAHYPADRVVVGAALRYAYLHDPREPAGETTPGGVPPRVLVVLTLKPDATLEVVEKTITALRRLRNLRVFVKPHPFGLQFAEPLVAALAGRVEVLDGTMEAALAAADVVVCAASGAVLEAVLARKHVIRIASEAQLDMDPLAWFPEFEQPVATSDDLVRRVQRALRECAAGTPPPTLPRLPSLFAAPTEEAMAAFLPVGRRADVEVA